MKKKIDLTCWWAFWIIYLEMIYKIFVVGNFFTKSTISVLLFSLIWIFIFSLLTRVFNKKINKIITIILSTFLMLITLAQTVYFNFYNSIFSVFSLTTGTGQVLHFYSAIIEVIIRIWYIFVLVLVPYILFLIFNKKIFTFDKINLKKISVYFSLLVLTIVGVLIRINVDNKGIYSLKNLVCNTHSPMLTINQTGLYSMEVIDLYRYLFGFEEKGINVDIDNDGIGEIEDKKEYNVLNIDFDSLIEKEDNERIKELHNYFKNTIPSSKNEYTGLFKGKNLIFITAESFDTIAIDENITPTLYKMANNGFIFTNYYQPLYPVSTSDGEYMNLMSFLPKEGTWSFKKTANLSMPYALGNVFKNLNYKTFAYHNYKHDFYGRNVTHPNIGFDYMACGNGLEKLMNCKKWPNSDIDMFKSTTKYYTNIDSNFATYYMTVSGHLNYNFPGNNMAMKHKSEVKNLKYSDAIKAYYATNIELDKSMEYLLNELDKSGKLDDTLIVIAPDHYPYGLTEKQINEVSKIDRDDKFELFHTSLIMYNPKLENKVIDKTISSLDILPTIYNLYGVDYDSRFFMGRDIFSDSEHIVILSDRSFITEKGKYNSVTGEFEGEDVDEEYINHINEIVSKRFSVSSTILDVDYFSKVEIDDKD